MESEFTFEDRAICDPAGQGRSTSTWRQNRASGEAARNLRAAVVDPAGRSTDRPADVPIILWRPAPCGRAPILVWQRPSARNTDASCE
jgi:hypothetical protein